MPINVHEFIRKWSQTSLTERSASQQHFLDLCELVGHPKPAEADPEGDTFTFEKGAAKYGGESLEILRAVSSELNLRREGASCGQISVSSGNPLQSHPSTQ